MNKVFLFVFFICLTSCIKGGDKSPPVNNEVINEMDFRDSILNYMFQLRIEHAEILLGQAILETHHFKSKIFLENNNLFGMKMPKQRPTLAIGINRGHAVFRNWKECIIDLAIWQSIYGRKMSEDKYFEMLEKVGYAEDPNYKIKVKSKIKNESRKSEKD